MKKGLLNVFIANLVLLIINLLLNLLIPKYVSIETYSLIKTYGLYISYAGFFGIGYNDGMYLKYGGKNIEEISKKDLSINIFNYFILIFSMFIITFVISLLINDSIMIAFCFGMVSYNITGYLKSLYQATGKFKLYGISLNLEKVVIFFFTIFALFVLKSDNYLIYIWIQVIVSIVVSLLLFINFEKRMHLIKLGVFRIREYYENIKTGFILLLGNFSNIIFTSMDRLFIKFLMDTSNFAIYSFAASMESIINVFVSPITITMYNYFCQKPSTNSIIKIKKLSLLYGFIVLSVAFPAKFILETFLTKYIQASEIIFFLFGAQLFYIIIKGIYVNIYKSQKKQNIYLIQMIIMILIGFILNILLYRLLHNTFGIALATFTTALIWLIICEVTNRDYRFKLNEYITITLAMILYLYCGFSFNSLLGCFIYLIGSFVINIIFMKSNLEYAIMILKESIKKLKSK